MTPADGSTPDPRPASPFLLLLLGGASSALGAEWLRFQWGAWLAVPAVVVGGAVTLTVVARAYGARRRWRRRRALADEAARAVPAAPGGDGLADQEPALVRAARVERAAAGVAGRDGEARDAWPAADGVRTQRRSLADAGRPATGAPSSERGSDRERVGAAHADADPERRTSRRDR